MRITIKDGNLYYFVNGDLVGSGPFTMPENAVYIKSSGTLWMDELRISTGDLGSTTAYTPSSSPYDTNMVLALPDELKANTIYVQHATPISAHRIGGVRPSAPTTGFFYILLHSDYTGGQPQLYDGANWVNVTAMVYVVEGGIQWRMLPSDFPKWQTVYYYFRVWSEKDKTGASVLDKVLQKLVKQIRNEDLRQDKTSFGIADAQNVQNADTAEEKDYDAGKKYQGSNAML